ncbi:MAG: histidine phosphatase family protein [Emticicia sp.]|nr:histidine phosphatase family protein [Emticicia sp.]
MEIYLIRHTEVIGSKTICYGQSNPPLAATFVEEAALLKAKLPTDFDAVYSSPLQRCRDLATALQFENVHFVDELKEINFGDWENRKWNDLNQEELNDWMSDFVHIKPPNGENLIELNLRVSSFG